MNRNSSSIFVINPQGSIITADSCVSCDKVKLQDWMQQINYIYASNGLLVIDEQDDQATLPGRLRSTSGPAYYFYWPAYFES